MTFAVDREAYTTVRDDEWPDDEPVPLVVVLHLRPVPANAVHLDEVGKTVAELNLNYPAESDVAEAIFTDTLDAYVGAVWKTWDRDVFEVELREHAKTWRVPTPTYSFPSPRLRDVGRLDKYEPDEAAEKAKTYLRWLARQQDDEDAENE